MLGGKGEDLVRRERRLLVVGERLHPGERVRDRRGLVRRLEGARDVVLRDLPDIADDPGAPDVGLGADLVVDLDVDRRVRGRVHLRDRGLVLVAEVNPAAAGEERSHESEESATTCRCHASQDGTRSRARLD